MMRVWFTVRVALITTSLAIAADAVSADLAVGITRSMDKFEGEINGEKITIMRDQNQSNTVTPAFAKTSRKCPPFCIQPMQMPQGVETIGELEMLDYLKRAAEGDDSILIIDSRGPDWIKRGTIPGSMNIHFRRLSLRSANETDIATLLSGQFGAQRTEEFWNFRDAKTLVLFCNGAWCGQSPYLLKRVAEKLLQRDLPDAAVDALCGLQVCDALGHAVSPSPPGSRSGCEGPENRSPDRRPG